MEMHTAAMWRSIPHICFVGGCRIDSPAPRGKETAGNNSRSSAISSKEVRKTKDKSKSPAKSGDLSVEETAEAGFKPEQSSFLPDIKSGIDEYNDVWRNKDEYMNRKQTHYDDMIYQEKYSEVEAELRKIVDELMRQELDLLQAALDRDRASKGKKSKKKKEKDLTPDRTTESLFEELVTNGIIRKYPETPLASYFGDKSYIERNGINPSPGDLKQLLIECCILPLGSEVIRNYSPCIRSILLAGPKGTVRRHEGGKQLAPLKTET